MNGLEMVFTYHRHDDLEYWSDSKGLYGRGFMEELDKAMKKTLEHELNQIKTDWGVIEVPKNLNP